MEPRMSDFPAPVSPVRTLSAGSNESSIRSTSASPWIESQVSIDHPRSRVPEGEPAQASFSRRTS